ncbi:MAG: serine hydrolase domain-containing protein [Phycisphaerales bacterium]
MWSDLIACVPGGGVCGRGAPRTARVAIACAGMCAACVIAPPVALGDPLGRDGQAAPEWSNEAKLRERVEASLEASGAPAMAAGVVTGSGDRLTTAMGERAAGTGVPVTIDDRWHIGSISKSFTAVLAARLVDEGLIDWDTTIFEAIPELEGTASRMYRRVTLEQLLGSRGGVPQGDGGVQRRLFELEGTPREQRMEAVAAILSGRPIGPPGARHAYSNFGFIVAGAMLERAADRSWEDLVREKIGGALGMSSLGFGAPGDPMVDAPDEPWGHTWNGESFRSVPPGGVSDNPVSYGPAGTIHASIGDLLKYAEAHLRTLEMVRDREADDDAETPLGIRLGSARRVYRVPENPDVPYALGLIVRSDLSGRPTGVWHNGSNTMWYAEMLVVADERGSRAAFVCANAMGDRVQGEVARLARELVGAD